MNDLIQKYQVVKEATKLQITLDSDDDDSSDKEDMKKEKKRYHVMPYGLIPAILFRQTFVFEVCIYLGTDYSQVMSK